MDDLMKCLYEFTASRRMGALWDDPEYIEATHTVEIQRKKLEKCMSEEQYEELQVLLESLSAHNSVESEHLFQAALRLSRELSALAREI